MKYKCICINAYMLLVVQAKPSTCSRVRQRGANSNNTIDFIIFCLLIHFFILMFQNLLFSYCVLNTSLWFTHSEMNITMFYTLFACVAGLVMFSHHLFKHLECDICRSFSGVSVFHKCWKCRAISSAILNNVVCACRWLGVTK